MCLLRYTHPQLVQVFSYDWFGLSVENKVIVIVNDGGVYAHDFQQGAWVFVQMNSVDDDVSAVDIHVTCITEMIDQDVQGSGFRQADHRSLSSALHLIVLIGNGMCCFHNFLLVWFGLVWCDTVSPEVSSDVDGRCGVGELLKPKADIGKPILILMDRCCAVVAVSVHDAVLVLLYVSWEVEQVVQTSVYINHKPVAREWGSSYALTMRGVWVVGVEY